MRKAKILVVDDDQSLLNLLKLHLEAADYQATLAETGTEAVACATEEVPHLAIVDLRIGEESGIHVLEKLLRIQPTLPVIIVTAHATIDTAVEATRKGAYDYITKPFEIIDLLHRLEKALEVCHLKGEVKRLRVLVQERYQFDNVIAGSEQMRDVLYQVVQIAATDSTVCI